jgi:hypothetical protein
MDQAIENKILERPKLLKSLPLFISFVVVESILGAKNTLQKGVCYLVGTRDSIRIWEDPWIPSIENFSPNSSSNITSPHLVVDLMTEDRLHWDTNILNNLFDPSIVQAILKIHLSVAHPQDQNYMGSK